MAFSVRKFLKFAKNILLKHTAIIKTLMRTHTHTKKSKQEWHYLLGLNTSVEKLFLLNGTL